MKYEIGSFSLEPKKIGARWYVEWGVCTYEDEERRNRWRRFQSRLATQDRTGWWFPSAQAAHAACREFAEKEKAR